MYNFTYELRFSPIMHLGPQAMSKSCIFFLHSFEFLNYKFCTFTGEERQNFEVYLTTFPGVFFFVYIKGLKISPNKKPLL